MRRRHIMLYIVQIRVRVHWVKNSCDEAHKIVRINCVHIRTCRPTLLCSPCPSTVLCVILCSACERLLRLQISRARMFARLSHCKKHVRHTFTCVTRWRDCACNCRGGCGCCIDFHLHGHTHNILPVTLADTSSASLWATRRVLEYVFAQFDWCACVCSLSK